MTYTGHGHVRPREDGVKARCGGPGMCSVCSIEAVQYAKDAALAIAAENADATIARLTARVAALEGVATAAHFLFAFHHQGRAIREPARDEDGLCQWRITDLDPSIWGLLDSAELGLWNALSNLPTSPSAARHARWRR